MHFCEGKKVSIITTSTCWLLKEVSSGQRSVCLTEIKRHMPLYVFRRSHMIVCMIKHLCLVSRSLRFRCESVGPRGRWFVTSGQSVTPWQSVLVTMCRWRRSRSAAGQCPACRKQRRQCCGWLFKLAFHTDLDERNFIQWMLNYFQRTYFKPSA